MASTAQAERLSALNWTLPSYCPPWYDIVFVVGLLCLYGRILHWMEEQREGQIIYLQEVLAHGSLVYLVIFCGLAWVWRGMLADVGLDCAPYLKYGILAIPAIGHGAITNFFILDRLEREEGSWEVNEPFKVQYAVSMIFVAFCWAYLAHLD